MIKYFLMSYRLSVKQMDGSLEPFSKETDTYVGNIVADTQEEAVQNLKDMFNMLHVDVLSCVEKSMTEEEYNSET